MAEEQKKPRTLWESALKVVKGDSTEQLVEQFTAEMTLVAEGLYDDQARLKREVELLRQEQDRLSQRVGSEQQAQETALMEAQRDFDKRLDDFARRLSAMEAKLSAKWLDRLAAATATQKFHTVAVASVAEAEQHRGQNNESYGDQYRKYDHHRKHRTIFIFRHTFSFLFCPFFEKKERNKLPNGGTERFYHSFPI